MRIVGEGATEVLSTVVRGEAEFGLNYIGAQEPEIEFVPILREPFVLVCQDYPLARKREVNWAELGSFEFITVAKASGNRLVMDLALVVSPFAPTGSTRSGTSPCCRRSSKPGSGSPWSRGSRCPSPRIRPWPAFP